MFRTLFPGDLLAELERLQRETPRYSGPASSIRGSGRGGFPALNVGSAPNAIEIYAFAPGLDPASINVSIEQGVLKIAGQRQSTLPQDDARYTVHIHERFAGPFHRSISLPEDADTEQVSARYNDGVLHISVKRRALAKRRQIAIQ